jgi:hypothetical protein
MATDYPQDRHKPVHKRLFPVDDETGVVDAPVHAKSVELSLSIGLAPMVQVRVKLHSRTSQGERDPMKTTIHPVSFGSPPGR